MKTLILDGTPASDDTQAACIRAALHTQLQARGWEVEHVVLREQKIGNCAGDFFCWMRSPGICMTNDANRTIAAKIVQCDLLIYLTPVTFGGYSSALKRMVDHQIQNISPFFTHIDGEVHHQRRYERYPAMLAIGWLDAPDADAEAVFRYLVRRNAINMYAPATVCGIVYAGQPEGELASQAAGWLDAVARRASTPVPALSTASFSRTTAAPVRRAALLVGSPRTSKSSSAALGGYLMEQLAGRGVATQTFQLYTTITSDERMRGLRETLDAADLIVLAFPIYVDSLPAPVIAALEQIAAHRVERGEGARLAAIANCGFPEAHHCAPALAACALFARQAGLGWAGSLALGAGEGIVHGKPLKELGGQGFAIRKALDLAAAALAVGDAIPRAATDLLAKPIIPAWLYMLMGGFGWRQQARRYGAHRQLRRQPYRKE